MADLSLDQLNELCAQLFQAQDNEQRTQADQKLQDFYESPDCIDKCIVMLTEGQDIQAPYTQLVASQTLYKLISSKNRQIPITKKLQLSHLLFNFLPQTFTTLAPYVLTSLCTLFARITKQEWGHSVADKGKDTVDYPFREPVFAIIKSIKIENISEARLATQMLIHVVSDMSSDNGMDTVSSHRRCAAQFREDPLLQIFKICVDFLHNNVVKTRGVLTEDHMMLIGNVLDLTLAVLMYDFIGISNAEDPGEENTNIQVPNSWKVVFTDGSPMTLLHPLYEKLPKRYTEKVLHVGVQLASIRRSFFTSQDRASYLNPLVEAVKGIAENPQKLEEPSSFHQFTRLVVRVKTNFQLFELLAFKDYPGLLSSLAQITIQSLWMADVSSNSIYFLIMFWARMVGSVPYHRTQEDHMIGNFVPQIYKAYVESRLRIAEKVITDGIEDPYLDHGSIVQTMEMMATISRYDLHGAHDLLLTHFDTNLNIIQNEGRETMRFKCAHSRMIWIITLIGTLIYGKRLVSQPEETDKLDGQLLARTIIFMKENDSYLSDLSRAGKEPPKEAEQLEQSFLFILESYRKAYIYSQTKPTSAVYEHLSIDVGIPDELEVISYFATKIMNNLRFWALNNTVLVATLELFKDISQGYTAARKLIRLPEMQILFRNHTSEMFPFLRHDVNYESMKSRTEFYEAITRVFLVDLNEDEEAFRKYLKPLCSPINQITMVMEGKYQIRSVDELQRIIIGSLRDIRGVAKACCTKTNYQLLFDWIYPRVFDIMHKSIEEWPDNVEIVLSVTRLMQDLSLNQQERLKFDLNSCSAVLLFKQLAKIIIDYGKAPNNSHCILGNKFLQLPPVAPSDKYRYRHKIVGSLFITMKHTLVGAYVPFGVFRLYGDTCLNDMLETFSKLFLATTISEIQTYPKLAVSYYGLVEMIARTNMPFLSRCQPETFIYILKSLSCGIFSTNHTIITTSCSALDDILSYLYKRVTKPPQFISAGCDPEGDECITAVQTNPEILSDMLTSMLSALVYTDMKCQWSLSRPMLGLILLQEYVFTELKAQIIQNMPAEHHQSINLMFENLMSGVELSLSVKNKDNFTQNVSRFRQELCTLLKTGVGIMNDFPSLTNDNIMSA